MPFEGWAIRQAEKPQPPEPESDGARVCNLASAVVAAYTARQLAAAMRAAEMCHCRTCQHRLRSIAEWVGDEAA